MGAGSTLPYNKWVRSYVEPLELFIITIKKSANNIKLTGGCAWDNQLGEELMKTWPRRQRSH